MHALWDILQESSIFDRQCTRTALCRFMAWLRAARKLLPHWHHLHWICEILAIEMDMLHGGKFVNKVALKTSVFQAALDQDATSSAVPSIDNKVLKICCQNAVVVSVMPLGDPDNKRLLHVMTCPCLPLNGLHSLQATECRSVPGNRGYAAKVVNGGFTHVITDIMKVCTDQHVMDECSFNVSSNDRQICQEIFSTGTGLKQRMGGQQCWQTSAWHG